MRAESRLAARCVPIVLMLALASATCGTPRQERQLWRFATFDRHFWHGWCNATEPLVDGDRVYVGGGYGWWNRDTALFALHRHTGAQLWKANASEGFSLGFTIASQRTLTITGDILLAGLSGGIAAFSTVDGTRRWFRSDLWPSFAEADGTVFAVTQSRLVALDLMTGADRWTAPLHEPMQSAPVVVGTRVYVAAPRLGALIAHDTASGREVARIDGLGGVNGLIAAAGNRILAGGSRAGHAVTFVVNPETSAATAHPALLVGLRGGTAWFATTGDGLEAMDVATERVTGIWPSAPDAGDGGILVDDDVFYHQELRTCRGGLVHAVSLATGTRRWSFQTGDWVNGMALTPEALYLSSEDCGLYAVRPGR